MTLTREALRAHAASAAREKEHGVPPPGPTLALDFLNTRSLPDDPVDQLRSPAALLGWLTERGLGEAWLPLLRTSPPEAMLLLAEARRLRDTAREAVESFSAGRALPDEAVHGIDEVLGATPVRRRLRSAARGLRLAEESATTRPLGALFPVALAVAELLTSADPGRVRRCAAANCGAWFLDTSKGGRRRWCSMAACGNRAKAARHRRRRRTTDSRSS